MRIRRRSAMYDAVRDRFAQRRNSVSQDSEGGGSDERCTLGSRPSATPRTLDQNNLMKRLVEPALALLLPLALAACSALTAQTYEGAKETVGRLAPKDITTHSVRSIKTISVNRIAVMPLVDDVPIGSEPLAPGASDAVTAELYSQASIAGGWEVIPQDDVMQAMQKLPPTTVSNLDQIAMELGRQVAADAVLYGSVQRYQERVGLDYSAATPASVTFSLKFV